MIPLKGSFTGLSQNNTVVLGLAVLIAILSGLFMYQSYSLRVQTSARFDDWFEDAKGYQAALQAQAQTQKPILLYFYATWCPHCQHFASDVLAKPEMQAFVKQYPHVRVAPDNGLDEQMLMSKFGAEGYPTFYVIRPHHQPVLVDTFNLEANPPRPKTAVEFIQSIRSVLSQPR